MYSIRNTANPYIPSQPEPTRQDPVHAAVVSGDSQRVLQLRAAGWRANVLDGARRSPVDVLDTMRGIDNRSYSGMRQALLQSLNPTAPKGYTKPETLHGSPWGLEILVSGALKGGVNDEKGGAQSLNGKVFFSDRTPQADTDTTTRQNLRTKARTYAQGHVSVSASASSRAQQHRLTQIIGQTLDKGMPLSLSERGGVLRVSDPGNIQQEAAAWMESFLHDKYIYGKSALPLLAAPLEQSAKALKLPGKLTLKSEHGPDQVLEGAQLQSFYKMAAGGLRKSLEGGKAPYLSMLNQGTVVPVVFGFDKVRNLGSHGIQSMITKSYSYYSYQNHDHPLSGSANGGRLKEVEVRSLADLATLYLGCEVKGARLPDDVLVRIKGAKRDKAEYLAPGQLKQFRANVLAQAAAHSPDRGARPLRKQALRDLQQINTTLRSHDLRAYLRSPEAHVRKA
ncbi:hypothetical protein [Janthinobacterium agaricidamnosum]|uniref:HopL n=1 Tax=Janthinobacterium agaricidamnosum NBRC 102515 = DSM 9628 TaxID=1349767 RepID=W0V2N4_9BURK|nr:hypothetical protein [Janthinobacterium agaricidamnosum]CDG83084.1 hopL [Janthinobacterium agaricidamnosum NBRC 102515 = DSM 9628]